MPITFHISPATLDDIPHLVELVNSAYRGDTARKGWTHEADLISGTKRIDAASLKGLLQKQGAIILKCTDAAHTLAGCVYLEIQSNQIYLGMLSVSPTIQGQGIGKRLLEAAEAYAREHNCNRILMTVISVRKELIDWYGRNGYSDSGRREPFPNDSRFGTPAKPLEFAVLEKWV